MEIFLHNTLTSKKEKFSPLKEGQVSMYNCGPTVYNFAHVGNLRSYVFADVLRKVFEYNGFRVHQVVNITDIGHLASDNDDGEDKMTKALKREGKSLTLSNMKDVAEFYFERFKEDIITLNIEKPEYFPFASDHINEDVEIITRLIERGFTYTISDGIYFDTSKFNGYGKLGNISKTDNNHSRIGLNPEKINQQDFAVWKFSKDLGYDAPFGKGFPGWHIECSAMSKKYLGQPFDIHTGGIDHVPVHHNNEIAQSEAAYDDPLAIYWLHNAHLNMGEEKMAKSGENFITLQTLTEKDINPLALRYVFLGARYSSPLQFSYEALSGAQTALRKLTEKVLELPDGGDVNKIYKDQFLSKINDDLDTAGALAIIWEVLKDDSISDDDKKATVLDFDTVLGLGVGEKTVTTIPDDVQKLVNERDLARKNKNFVKSDELRDKIESMGYVVKDAESKTVVEKR